ncbi:MAG: DUF115 domain-containing protein [Desulfurivibrio sp.]|nr:MAG: DUF115 domain-containing protein [Desulfurivibrio sp.]
MLRILPLGKIFPEYYQAAAATLKRLLLAQYMQSNTTMLRGKDMVENSFQLLPDVIAASPLESLRGFAPGVPAIITAAGPSLKENIKQLKGKEKEIIILAVDSAVPTLLENGITPHFITTMDYRHRNADFLWGNLEKLSSCALIFLGLTTPFIPKLLPGKKFAVYDEAPVNSWFNRMTGGHLPIKNLSSVAHLSLFAAQLMECNPIIFAGLDLSWTGPVDQATVKKEDLQQVPGIKEEEILTTPNFLVMIDKFEKMMESSVTTFIDSTEGGARLQHTLLMPLQQSLATYGQGPLQLPVLPENVSSAAIRNTCLTRLAETRKNLLTLRQEYLTIKEQADWACNFLNNHIQQNKPLRVSQQLADTVNFLKQRHAELVSSAGSDELNATAHLLDILLAKQRLASHGKRIEWQKKYPDKSGISALLVDMLFHQMQASDMLEAISWFMQRVETALARIELSAHPPEIEQNSSGDALLHIGKIYFDSFDLLQARQVFITLLERQPEHGQAYYYLGKIHLLLRQLPVAMDHFRAARSLSPELGNIIDAIIADISAEFLENAKDRIKRKRHGARKYLQDILPGFPDYEEAQLLLASIN